MIRTLLACMVGIVLVPLVLPWCYVFNQYLKAPGDRWRRPAISTAPTGAASPSQKTAL